MVHQVAIGTGNNKEVEVLVCPEERVDETQCPVGIDVVVELAVDQQQLAAQDSTSPAFG